MKQLLVILSLFSLFYISVSAQPCNCPTVPKRPERPSRNEIGISGGALYSPDHKEWGSSISILYFRSPLYHSKWSFGGGIERVWLDGAHWAFFAGTKYEIFDHFSLSVLPGVMLLNNNHPKNSTTEIADSERKTLFSLHTEIVYDLLNWEKFHLGPAIDYVWAKEHSNFMFGIHGAFGF